MATETQAFIDRIAPFAVENQNKYGILASLTIAQAILESGWGRSVLATQANNLFGIKGTGPAGSFTIETTDYRDGQPYQDTAVFRKYNSWQESIEDHAKFLQAPRYQAIIGEADYKTAARKMQTAGYTTDPAYPDNLIRLIEQYQLSRYDAPRVSAGPATQQETGVVTVLVDALNLRSGPGLQYPVLRTLAKGTRWKVYGSPVHGWYNLGGDQWCSAGAAYVSFSPSPPAPSAPKSIGIVEILTDLNLRRGPGTQFDIIRILRPGERYVVFTSSNGWYNLGGNQWCSAGTQYVRFIPT
ncbi:glucosaminidase domain-containing protein [Ectobacillus ponti]|uniref:Glucosaminidase domain-containing protein n=1 Tax=Ectobacillus ponti TaxID=2961894 RepID=A0AA42BRC5_9BACI|nr:glucosaminidase domain-containing protein [Ectobacillus ponti]MCP8970782.1 glucosaminidase domain-containing protein [Ectobacillus ponti]